jgi:hypothetical protein
VEFVWVERPRNFGVGVLKDREISSPEAFFRPVGELDTIVMLRRSGGMHYDPHSPTGAGENLRAGGNDEMRRGSGQGQL